MGGCIDSDGEGYSLRLEQIVRGFRDGTYVWIDEEIGTFCVREQLTNVQPVTDVVSIGDNSAESLTNQLDRVRDMIIAINGDHKAAIEFAVHNERLINFAETSLAKIHELTIETQQLFKYSFEVQVAVNRACIEDGWYTTPTSKSQQRIEPQQKEYHPSTPHEQHIEVIWPQHAYASTLQLSINKVLDRLHLMINELTMPDELVASHTESSGRTIESVNSLSRPYERINSILQIAEVKSSSEKGHKTAQKDCHLLNTTVTSGSEEPSAPKQRMSSDAHERTHPTKDYPSHTQRCMASRSSSQGPEVTHHGPSNTTGKNGKMKRDDDGHLLDHGVKNPATNDENDTLKRKYTQMATYTAGICQLFKRQARTPKAKTMATTTRTNTITKRSRSRHKQLFRRMRCATNRYPKPRKTKHKNTNTYKRRVQLMHLRQPRAKKRHK